MARKTRPSGWDPDEDSRSPHSLGQWTRLLGGLAESAVTVDEALESTLRMVCARTGWPLGHVFLYDPAIHCMSSTGIWADSDPELHRPLVEASQGLLVGPGRRLPGLILDALDPVWVDDLGAGSGLLRAEAARSCGMAAAVGYPIIGSGQAEGVMEFFLREPAAPGPDLADMMLLIGSHLGQMIERQRTMPELVRSEGRFRRLIEHAPDAVFAVGPDGLIQVVNAEAERLSGRRRDELIGSGIDMLVAGPATVVHESYRAAYGEAPRRRHLGSGRDLLLLRKDGSTVPVDISLSPIDEDRSGLVVAVVRDVTDRRMAAEAARRSESRLAEAQERRRRAAEELADHHHTLERIARGEPLGLILETVCAGVEKRHPGSHCSVALLDDKEQVLRLVAAPTLPREWSGATDPVPVRPGAGACGTAAALGETVVVEDISTDDLTRASAAVAARCGIGSVWSVPLRSSGGSVIGTFAIYHPAEHRPGDGERAVVTAAANLAALAMERHLNEQALGLAAQRDPLTELPNRARFLEELEQRLAVGRDRITVMFLDLDRFKWVNDSLGHPAGDRILAEAAERLRAVVPDRYMVARFGGDEFTVMLTNCSPSKVLATAERIEEAFAAPFELDGGEFFLSASIGIATGGDEAHSMIRDADAAMYEAKARSRGRHVWFDERLRHRVTDRLQAESKLRRAIERSEFVLHYQPIADLGTGCWTGVEALVRWRRPDGTLVAPMEFIPLAEETGLILPLGSAILKGALAEIAELGLAEQGLTVAVNVSALQLSNPDLVEDVAKLLSAHDIPPDCLVIELTESALMENYDSALAALHDIASLGASVVIDDFGTGYSSVSRLTELPVGGVKVDRSFTARIGRDPTVDAVLAAIIDLAHAIGLTVVAEGIESEAALVLLRALGCDSGQGYHLAAPLPPAQLLTTIQEPAASYR